MSSPTSQPDKRLRDEDHNDAGAALQAARQRHWRLNLRWSLFLLLMWALVTFGVAFFARPLSIDFLGWPFSFWVAAQGALIVYGILVLLYARVMKALDRSIQPPQSGSTGFEA